MLTPFRKTKSKIGECDGPCGKVDVEIFPNTHNMWLCQECTDSEQAAITRAGQANKLLEDARKLDSSASMKTDLFVLETVPAIELRAAIDNDENFKTDAERDIAFTNECHARRLHFAELLKQKRAEVAEIERTHNMWFVNVQTSAAKLAKEYRDKFKEYDSNYQPTAPTKKVKTIKPTGPARKFNKTELYAAAKKYNVPANGVQMIWDRNKEMTYEQAAHKMAVSMGLIES